MRSFTETAWRRRWWLLVIGLTLAACVQLPPDIPGTAPFDRATLAQKLAALALQEHERMGGALIDAGGGLIRGGHAEAERERTGRSGEPAWLRVQGYWAAVPGGWAERMRAGSVAEQRVRIVDVPWSAAFISHLMRAAGLGSSEFQASASHHDYVRAAFAAGASEAQGVPTHYAYRACDLARTAPRVGDLLCSTRGVDARRDDFEQVRAGLAEGALSMHCELVVQRDEAGIDAVGGNVLDTVTRRRLALAPDGSGRLWPAYLRSAQRAQAEGEGQPPAEGEAQALLPDTHLNRRPWSVLLQLRERQAAPGAAVREAGCD